MGIRRIRLWLGWKNVLVKVKHLLGATQLHPQLALSHLGGALQGNSPIRTLALGKILADAAHLARQNPEPSHLHILPQSKGCPQNWAVVRHFTIVRLNCPDEPFGLETDGQSSLPGVQQAP